MFQKQQVNPQPSKTRHGEHFVSLSNRKFAEFREPMRRDQNIEVFGIPPTNILQKRNPSHDGEGNLAFAHYFEEFVDEAGIISAHWSHPISGISDMRQINYSAGINHHVLMVRFLQGGNVRHSSRFGFSNKTLAKWTAKDRCFMRSANSRKSTKFPSREFPVLAF